MSEPVARAAPSPNCLVLLGPTASGKSALALDIAERANGTIINADSMQLYADLRVLTARPDATETARAPHRLYGVLDGAEACSAHRWRAMAEAEIRAALDAGRLPILVGGTGFYVKAMLEGLSPMPDVPDAVREAVRARLATEGALALHAELERRDPAAARRIEPKDGQRIARALEVLEASGRPLSAWQAAPKSGPPEGLSFRTLVLAPPRAALVARCEARLDAMLEAGALAEVAALLARDLPAGAPVMKAVGVPELAAHLRGETTRDEASAAAKTATRRYAKRQMTWLRGQILSDLTIEAQYSKSVSEEAFSFIRENGLTP